MQFNQVFMSIENYLQNTIFKAINYAPATKRLLKEYSFYRFSVSIFTNYTSL